MTKVCSKCKQEKPYEEFYKQSKNKDGLKYRCSVCDREDSRIRGIRDPSVRRSRHLKSNYNITIKDFNKMLEEQEYCCAICGTKDPGGNGRFHVDHNHCTGKVRGLLCHHCNTSLGGFKDSIPNLQKAIEYLEKENKS